MIELRNDTLHVSFPEVHEKAECAIAFQRTLRVPDDNQDYPLPAGFGRFPLHAVDDHPVPDHWREDGGVFLPMYQSEALWIALNEAYSDYPFAVKIAAGKINAVTGEPWKNALHAEPQDYVVIPRQPWLDGFHVDSDAVRQFVAMPLGEGLTAEGQLTGAETWGGVQLIFYPMKAEVYERRFPPPVLRDDVDYCLAEEAFEMGLAPGGRIRQVIKKDPYGIDDWDTSVHSRCFVHLLNSEDYGRVTGREPPPTPVTAQAYADAGVPWFDWYGEGKDVPAGKLLPALDGIAAALGKRGRKLADNRPIPIANTIRLHASGRQVRDGAF
jgi:hypothetical protein